MNQGNLASILTFNHLSIYISLHSHGGLSWSFAKQPFPNSLSLFFFFFFFFKFCALQLNLLFLHTCAGLLFQLSSSPGVFTVYSHNCHLFREAVSVHLAYSFTLPYFTCITDQHKVLKSLYSYSTSFCNIISPSNTGRKGNTWLTEIALQNSCISW